MRVLITGSSGFLGSALGERWGSEGHELAALVRRSPRSPAEIPWDPATGGIEASSLRGFDAVVHLAGESVAGGRWTEGRRSRILDSRVRGTRALAEALATCEEPPRALLCASAIGYYGDRGDALLDESAEAGSGFLPEVCRAWEGAADPAREAGIRVAHLRIGIALGRGGGALARMLPAFRMGLGGRLGSGRQWMSWIAIDDLVAAFDHVLRTDSLDGAVNAVGPEPATGRELARTLGRVLARPAILPVPAIGLRLALGRMADELLLASARVEPRALRESGFEWAHPKLEGALRHLLGRG